MFLLIVLVHDDEGLSVGGLPLHAVHLVQHARHEPRHVHRRRRAERRHERVALQGNPHINQKDNLFSMK